MNKLPEKLLLLRKHYNYSQSYVAEQLGISTIEYMGFENGRCVPSFLQLKLLAKFFKITPVELFDNRLDLNLDGKKKKSVDKKNMAYLSKISKAERRRIYLEKNGKKLALVGVLLGIILVLLYAIGTWIEIQNTPIIFMEERVDNIFSASNTTTVYIDSDNKVAGFGDNSNGQLNNLPTNAFKVQEGGTFTATLLKDGTVKINGLMTTAYKEEIESWTRIVDIAVGNGHVLALTDRQQLLCVGNNSLGQCEFNGRKDVSRIFASGNASFILNLEGELEYSGDFIGKSKLKYVNNIVDIEANDYILAYITSDNHLVVHSLIGDYSETKSWNNLVDIAIGKDFVAALNKNNEVLISTSNELTKVQVTTFHDVKAIASGIDYLSAYTGVEVLGAGNNAYKQFKENEIQKLKLANTKNVVIDMKEDRMVIAFDKVEHAIAYELHLDGEVYTSEENKFSFEFDELENNQEYNAEIIAIGEGIYENSDPAKVKFIFLDPRKTPNGDEEITIGAIVGMKKSDFEDYILSIGADRINFKSTESNELCKGEDVVILDVKGIKEGDIFKRKEIALKPIEYTYCKFVKAGN